MNKICPECGKEINENLNVCPNCGYQINNKQNNEKNKKLSVWAIILIVIACLLPLIIIGIVILPLVFKFNVKTNINTSANVNYPIELKGKSGYIEITYNEYEEKVKNKEHFVVVISRDGCYYCELYAPIVEKVANENKLPIYNLDIADLTDKEYTELVTNNGYLVENRWGTPTTLYMYGNAPMDVIGGYVDEDTLEDFLDDYFVMK